MSLAMTQQVSSAASLSTPVNEPVFAPLHMHFNYGAQKNKEINKLVCLLRWAKSILMKETVGRAWDFNHGDTEPTRSSAVPVISVQYLTKYETHEMGR